MRWYSWLILCLLLAAWFGKWEDLARERLTGRSPQSRASQSQSFFKYGLGLFNSAKDSAVEVKTLSIGRQKQMGSHFVWQWEAGVWSDSRRDQGRSSSFFGNMGMGLNVDAKNVYAQALWGIAAISNTDAYLGGRAQFNQDFSIGLKDSKGVRIGVSYKHISSAGIFEPNIGRDFATIRLAVPW